MVALAPTLKAVGDFADRFQVGIATIVALVVVVVVVRNFDKIGNGISAIFRGRDK